MVMVSQFILIVVHRNLYTAAVRLVPSVGSQLGGTPVEVLGPCFDEDDTIMCYFGNNLTQGIYVDRNSAICVSPEMDGHGRIQVKVQIINANGNEKYDNNATFTSGKSYFQKQCHIQKDIQSSLYWHYILIIQF